MQTEYNVCHTFFIAALSDSRLVLLAKLVGQHFIIPTIESVNAKYESTRPSSASFNVVLMDIGSLL